MTLDHLVWRQFSPDRYPFTFSCASSGVYRLARGIISFKSNHDQWLCKKRLLTFYAKERWVTIGSFFFFLIRRNGYSQGSLRAHFIGLQQADGLGVYSKGKKNMTNGTFEGR